MLQNRKKIVIALVAFSVMIVLAVVGYIYYSQFWLTKSDVVSPDNMRSLPKLSVSSDFDAIVSLKSQGLLEAKLGETGFWDEKNVSIYTNLGAISSRESIVSLHIILSDKPQTLGRVESVNPDGTRHRYQSFGMSYDKALSKLTLILHVDPTIIKTEGKEALERRFSGLLLSAVYDLTHPPLPEHTNFSDRLAGKDDFLKPFVENSENYFEINL